MHLTKAELEAALGRPAYIAEEEIEPLCRYAAQTPENGALVEIGAAWGASATLMLLSAPATAHVYSFDPFVPHEGWQASITECHDAVRRALRARLCEADWSGTLKRWGLYKIPSHDAAEMFGNEIAPDRIIDLLYIDGDHAYESVAQDFALWLPRVRKGGAVFLHDSRRLPGTPDGEFARGWPGPTQVANELREWQAHAPRRCGGQDCPVELIEEAYSLTIWRVR